MKQSALAMVVATATLVWALGAWAGQKPVSVHIPPLPRCLHPGQAINLVVELVMAPGVKITGPQPAEGLGIPTSLKVNAYSRWIRIGPPHIPAASGGHYQGRIRFTLPVEVERGAPPGVHELAISLEYQACQGDVCMLPEAWERLVKLRVCPGYLRGTNQKQGSSATSGRASSR